MSEDEKTSVIHFVLPTRKKSAYVRAARQSGQKLVPWVLEALDKAACETTQPGRMPREAKNEENT